MNTSQYTIRGIPNALLQKVESESRRTKRSKNEILLDALKASLDNDSVQVDSVKWYEKFIGTMSLEDAEIVNQASRASRQMHPKDYL